MSQRVSNAEVVNPATLSEAQKRTFIDRLYALHRQIFSGVDKQTFISYVIDSPAKWTRIRIYKNPQNVWVGYCAVHRFPVQLNDKSCVVFRAEAGILRQYRGRSMTLWFGFSEAIKYHCLHPLQSIYYLGCFVHPAVLYMFSRYMYQFYPRPDVAIPATIKQLMLKLAEVFHLQKVAGQNELVRQIGWITLESEQDRAFWQGHPNAAVQFYLRTNPGYVEGNGLLMLMPLTSVNIVFSFIRFVAIKARKVLSGR